MEEQSDTPRTGVLVPSEELKKLQRERDEARTEVERLRVALFFVIEDADVWHDVARGGQSDNITADIRALAATEAKP